MLKVARKCWLQCPACIYIIQLTGCQFNLVFTNHPEPFFASVDENSRLKRVLKMSATTSVGVPTKYFLLLLGQKGLDGRWVELCVLRFELDDLLLVLPVLLHGLPDPLGLLFDLHVPPVLDRIKYFPIKLLLSIFFQTIAINNIRISKFFNWPLFNVHN